MSARKGSGAEAPSHSPGETMAHEVRLQVEDAVATITMANPPNHTMTAAMVGELAGLVERVAADEAARVLVLTGGGEGVFVAHYEVAELADAAERQQRPSSPPAAPTSGAAAAGDDGQPRPTPPVRLHPFNRLMRRLEAMDQITVAAVNGTAMGGGCELSLACDFRLLVDGPYGYGLPETSVGIIPGAGGTQRLARLLGPGRALDLILHAQVLSPAEALALGLVHRLLAPATFAAEVQAFAADLARRAPLALAAAKRAIRGGTDLALDDGLLLEQEEFARCMGTRDAAGAMRASLRGQRYEFEGR